MATGSWSLTSSALRVYILISSLILTQRFAQVLGNERVRLSFDSSIQHFSTLRAHGLLEPRGSGDLRQFGSLGHIKLLDGQSPVSFPTCFELRTKVRREQKTVCLEVDGIENEFYNGRVESHPVDLQKLGVATRPFNSSKRTVVIIPGFMNEMRDSMLEKISSVWLDSTNDDSDVNLILVHWPAGAHGLYPQAAWNTRLVARQIVIYLHYLCQLQGCLLQDENFLSKLYLVGHSLGAHISGFVGQELGGRVDRITGLDPAGPTFDHEPEDDRLDSSDAKFVDIFHTNAGTLHYAEAGVGAVKAGIKKVASYFMSRQNSGRLFTGEHADDTTAWFGLAHSCGDVDYYVNGGSVQPGCNDELHICDHSRAWMVYAHALEYQLAKSAANSSRTQNEEHLSHLLAFAADSYEEFRSGDSIRRLCRTNLGHDYVSLEASQKLHQLEACTLPIDLLKTGSEWRRTLKAHDLLDHRQAPRFYFETLSKEPFMSSHYLIKVRQTLFSNERRWSADCQLLVIVQSSYAHDHELVSGIETSTGEMLESETMNFAVVNPLDWRSSPSGWRPPTRVQLIYKNHDSSWAPVRYVKSAFNYLFGGRHSDQEQEPACKLPIESVEAQPITAFHDQRNIVYKPVDDPEARAKNIESGRIRYETYQIVS